MKEYENMTYRNAVSPHYQHREVEANFVSRETKTIPPDIVKLQISMLLMRHTKRIAYRRDKDKDPLGYVLGHVDRIYILFERWVGR